MKSILRELILITENMNKFLVFLGPNLKAVTGNSEGIDKLFTEVKALVLPFKNAKENFFEKANVNVWNQLISSFKQNQGTIENSTIRLIDDTFKDLRSSEGAFDLLNNFKNIATLDEIAKKLQKKYTDVLNNYRKELDNNRALFEKGKKLYEDGHPNMIISRGKPPIAGIISWASNIMQRIKSPILKFHKNE